MVRTRARVEMDRGRLEQLSLTELKQQASRYQLPTTGDRNMLLDAIMTHLEKTGPSDIIGYHSQGNQAGAQTGPPQSSSRSEQPSVSEAVSSALSSFSEILLRHQEEMQRQQQSFMLQLAQQFAVRGNPEPVAQVGASDRISRVGEESAERTGSPARSSSGQGTVRTMEGMPPGNAVNWLATQVPEFSGTEDENVVAWVHRVDKVAEVHRASDGIVLLAASSKLIKVARQWYDYQTGSVIESWQELRNEMVRVFDRKVPIYKATQKAELRKWIPHKETFDQYAIAKMALIHQLNLPESDSVHLLIGGITNNALRATALSIAENRTVKDFLHLMRNITSGLMEPERKPTMGPTGSNKPKETKDGPCRNCSRKGHSHKECRSELSCFYCRAKGHRQFDCPSLNRKGRPASQQHQGPSTAAAITSTEEAGAVALVTIEDGNQLQLSGPYAEIDGICGQKCHLTAMIDTGSPVSFVKYDIYKRYIEPLVNKLNPSKRKFTNLKELPLEVVGCVSVDLSLRSLENKIVNIGLYVIKDQAFIGDIILGREFIDSEDLTLIYKPRKSKSRAEKIKENLFSQLPLRVEEDQSNGLKQILTENQIDFNETIKKRLVDLIVEIERREIIPAKDDYSVRVYLKDDSTYAYAPRRFAFAEKIKIREITDDLLRRGIIQPSVSPYCARVIPVKKKNGELRLCVDLRPLNSRVHKQKYPFPIIEDCLSRLTGKSIFTLLDLRDSFHQIRVHPESTKYFSFATPDGQYEYKCLPFGYSEAPAEFQKRLLQILSPLIRRDEIIVYMDDVLIPSDTVERNLEVLRETLDLLKKYNFELNYSKCLFLKKKVEFLGYVISGEGITLSPRHTEAIEKFKRPENVHEVQRFLGLASYFRKFIKDFSLKAKPIQNLLKKDNDFNFDSECQKAFSILKRELTSSPVLALYNPSAETELHTDASSVGLGAILLQKQQNGLWAAVAFFSQSTNIAESRYHSYELEMLAIVRAVERFHLYLAGLSFIIVTDCNAIVYAVNKANLNPRIARWTLTLQNYQFRIVHRPCARMQHVDALSRCVGYVGELALERQLEFSQLADSRIKEISYKLEYEDSDKFKLIDGLVYKKDGDNVKFVVPESMVPSLLRAHHDDMAHPGVEKTFRGINSNFWFPHMRKKIHQYLENCLTCAMANDSRNRFEGETSLYEAPRSPMEVLHMDHFGPLQESNDGYKHILVIVDSFTRFTWLYPVKSTTTREVIEKLSHLFSTFGSPTEIVSDRGTAFTSEEFSKYITKYKIKHRKVAVASPWANGTVERVNRFIKSSLSKLVEFQSGWRESLGNTQYIINNTYHKVTRSTPSKMMFGYEQRNHADFMLSRFTKELANVDTTLEAQRAQARDTALSATEAIRTYNKKYRDERSRKPSMYKEGEYVLVRSTRVKPGESSKLKTKYKGPYMIGKCLGNNRYVVKDIPGFNITARPYNTIVSSDKLKRWITYDAPPGKANEKKG